MTSNGTIVVPAGVTVMDVQAWGGGGAGGGAGGSGLLEGRSGGGGGGGAYARSNINVTASNTLNVVVAGTVAGTVNNGAAGGHSTITGYETVIYAAGGAGGLANNAGGAPAGGTGGSTAASFGTTKTAGEAGGTGGNVLAALLLSSGKGGNGASPGGGAGGASVPSLVLGTTVGNPGAAPGGGGSGSMSSALAAAQPGGSGASGQVIVTYTCPTYSITGISAVNVCSNLGTTSVVTLTSSAASLPTGTYTVTYSRSNPSATGLTAIMTVTTAGTGTFTAAGLNTVGTSNITVTNLTSGVCSSAISTSNVTTVTIFAPSAGGTVSGGTTICAGATSAALSLAGQTGTIQKWQYSIAPFSTWTDIANTTNTYISGPLSETTEFRAVVQNGVCTAANSIATTVTVNPLPQGTLSANGPFCVTGSGQLTFTATAGTGPYTVVYKENGGADRTATGVVSGTPFNTFTTPVTATTTYTLVSVTGANTCSRSSGFTGNTATITINPLPQGSLTANGPFCATGSGLLTFTATAGIGPYTVVYKENGGADRTASGVVSGTPFAAFTPTVTATTTYTLVSVTGSNTCIRNSGFTAGSATITVNPLPQGSLTANGPFCETGAGQLTFTATSGAGPYTIVYKENGGADRTATGVVSGTPFNTFTTPVTATTTYTLVSVTGSNTCVRSSGFTAGSTTITVNPLPQGSLTANGPFCVTGSGQLTFTATAGTGPYTIVYKENGGADQTAAGVVSGTPFATFTTPVTATTTYTLVSVTGANTCVRSSGFTTGSATITVNPLPQGSLSANSPFCATGSGQLTFTATAGTGPYTVVYKENGGADRTATGVVSGTPFATFTTPVTATTTYTLVSVTGANSCVRSSGFTAGSTTITVNPLPQGSLTANGPFCATGAGQLTFTATSGTGPYTVVYKENGGADRTASGVVSGTPFATFTAPVITTTTYTLVSVTGANTCARNSGFTGGSAAITINPIPTPTFTTQPAASVCVNTDVTYTTQTGQSNYVWNVPGVLNTDYIITSGDLSASSNTVTLQWLTVGSKTVTVGYSSIGCASNTSASNTTTVTKTERGAVHGGNHICAGDPSPLLTLTDYTGTIVRWEYAESIPYVWQPFANTSNTYQPGVLTTSTSYRAVVKNGTCPEEFAIETRIDVEPKPSTPILAIITQPTCVNPNGSVHLTGLLASPNWTITQNGTVSQTYTSSGTSYTITNLAPGNYTFTIHDINICPSLPTINLEIKAPVTNIWNGTSWSKGSPPIVTDAVRFSGNYSTTGDLSGCSCVVDAGANVTINSNHTLTITNSVSNNGGLLTFENNASLMQVNNVVNTGNIIYKRNTTPVRRYDFTYWSSPIVRTPAFTLHDLSPNTLSDKYYSHNAISGWIINYNGTMEMSPGYGYIVRAPQNFDISAPSVYNSFLEGVPNNGTITVPLVAAEKSHLLGNPYPSAIYADQFIFDNAANLYGTLYFWTHNSAPSSSVPGDAQFNYNSDDYAIYNLTGSTSVGSLSGQGAGTPGNQTPPLGYIAAGQAFFVKAKTTGNAVFTNSMRIPGNNSQFFKTAESNKETIEKHRVWLNMTNTQGLFKQLLVGYIEGATDTWDNNYDGVTINGNIYVDFYSINEGRKLTVQGRAVPFQDTDVVPLGYRSGIEGEFSIAIDHADGDLANHAIYLEDKWNNTTHNLQTGKYTFNTSIGTFLDRFVLKYAAVNLGVDDFESQENNLFVSVKNKNIKVNSTHDYIKEVSIFDISGKLIYNNKKIENTELQIPNLQSGDQVLIVKVTLENGKTTTRKITFH
ncbi:T9SS sorting signal type C domain-containing protein [Flavobacterium panici]|uniref:T9SS sorting signal type C domain-containing protein n=1 Tax=Flavobacterium panici TaxID=2654843 RepID=UPI0015DFFF78|nr:T9SS sorting signal type C domain-containing protein [Flavobacterium panici]